MNIQEYQQEISQLKTDVKKGNVGQARKLGSLLYGGVSGKEKNFSTARPYLEIAATKANDTKAQYFLGKRYEQGKEVKQDLTLAMLYYYCAAFQNHPDAQYNLGRLLVIKFGRKGKEWLHWICCAALSNHKTACEYLENFNGCGILKSFFLSLLASKLSASIQNNGIDPEKNGIELAIDPHEKSDDAFVSAGLASTPNEVAYYETIHALCEIVLKVRRSQDSESQTSSADPEYDKEVQRLRAEVDAGDVEKARDLAFLILEGADGEQFNWNEALRYFEIAATDANDAECQYFLGRNAEDHGDIEYATALYRSSAEQKFPFASYALGHLLYETGNPDEDEDSEWLFWIVVSYVQNVDDDAAKFISTLDEETQATIPDIVKIVKEAGF